MVSHPEKQKQNAYSILSRITAVVCLALFVMLFFFPRQFPVHVGVEASASTDFFSRRTSMIMLGLSILAFRSRKAIHSDARQAIILAFGITMAALAVLGSAELYRGVASVGILRPISVELTLAVSYLVLWLRGRRL